MPPSRPSIQGAASPSKPSMPSPTPTGATPAFMGSAGQEIPTIKPQIEASLGSKPLSVVANGPPEVIFILVSQLCMIYFY